VGCQPKVPVGHMGVWAVLGTSTKPSSYKQASNKQSRRVRGKGEHRVLFAGRHPLHPDKPAVKNAVRLQQNIRSKFPKCLPVSRVQQQHHDLY
jgi:hypothetical protein